MIVEIKIKNLEIGQNCLKYKLGLQKLQVSTSKQNINLTWIEFMKKNMFFNKKIASYLLAATLAAMYLNRQKYVNDKKVCTQSKLVVLIGCKVEN